MGHSVFSTGEEVEGKTILKGSLLVTFHIISNIAYRTFLSLSMLFFSLQRSKYLFPRLTAESVFQKQSYFACCGLGYLYTCCNDVGIEE